jgi:hypothetical protein
VSGDKITGPPLNALYFELQIAQIIDINFVERLDQSIGDE